MNEIVIDAIGIPAPVGSKVRMPNGAIIEGGKGGAARRASQEAWKAALGRAIDDHLRVHPMAPLTGPVSVHGAFLFPLPASDPYRTLHVGFPDLDKIQRLVGDLLKASGIVRDDSIIYRWDVEKVYARGNAHPGCRLIIRDHTEEEARWRDENKRAAAERRRTRTADQPSLLGASA